MTLMEAVRHIDQICRTPSREGIKTREAWQTLYDAALKTVEGQKPSTNNASRVIVLQKEALKHLNKLPKSVDAAKVELLIKGSIARLQAIA